MKNAHLKSVTIRRLWYLLADLCTKLLSPSLHLLFLSLQFHESLFRCPQCLLQPSLRLLQTAIVLRRRRRTQVLLNHTHPQWICMYVFYHTSS